MREYNENILQININYAEKVTRYMYIRTYVAIHCS